MAGGVLSVTGNSSNLLRAVTIDGGASAGAIGRSTGPGAPVTLVNQGLNRASNAGQTITVDQ